MRQIVPPSAYAMYPLRRGWRAMPYVVRGLLAHTRTVCVRWFDHAASMRYIATQHFFLVKYWAWLLVIGFYIAAILQYIPALLLAVLFLIFYPLLLSLWLVSAFLCLAVFICIRWFYRKLASFNCRCPFCYKESSQPAYLCSGCGVPHLFLRPSLQGLCWHCCRTCQTRLPVLDILGRGRLTKACPVCQQGLNNVVAKHKSVHLALVGGSAAGKTTYMTAALQAWLREDKKRGAVAFVDTAQASVFEKNVTWFKTQGTVHTKSILVPPAWLLDVRSFWRSQLLYIYDPAGEAFTNSLNASKQAYYAYSDGIIFVIDGSTQVHRKGDREIMRTYECMIQAFEHYVGLSKRRRYTQPVAVLVTRAGSLSDWSKPSEPHAEIRGFLCAHGLDNFVRDLEAHFVHVRYFACEALQELCNDGNLESASHSDHVLEPLRWVLLQ